jgi:hypothetical protein
MGLQVIRFSELYKEFLVPFSFVENYYKEVTMGTEHEDDTYWHRTTGI